MTSMEFEDSRAGKTFPLITRLPVPEASSKDDTSISVFPLSADISDSGASGVYPSVNSHGLVCATKELSHSHGHSQYSHAMVTPSLAASSGRSDFSCTSESQPDHAARGAVSPPMQGKVSFTEHDYIGLSETSRVLCEGRISSVGGGILDLNFGETELRLGPPGAFHSRHAPFYETHPELKSISDAADEEREQNHVSNEQISCRGEAMVPCPGDGVKNSSRAFCFPSEKPDIPMDGPRMYSVPQTTVAGAKRAFAEVICSQFAEEQAFSAPVDTVLSSSAADAESKHTRTRLMPPAYPWGSMNQMPAMNLDQQRIPSQTFPSTLSFQEHQNVKQPGAASSIGLKDFNAKPWDTCPKIVSDSSYGVESASEAQYGQSDSQEMLPGDDGENAPASSSPVVGWPPVQSFRNKALATQPQPKLTSERQTSSTTPLGSILLNSLFVKVFMDGVAIGRKVDMKSSDSYEKLSSVLEEMFHRFMSGKGKAQKSITENITLVKNNKETTCRHGSEYVLTYKDKDGDLMLVGDVPWSMFIGTVKRLRIMKGSDAIGLAPKALEKEKFKP